MAILSSTVLLAIAWAVLIAFARRAAARHPPPPLRRAAAVPVWILGGLYLASLVALAAVAVCLVVMGDVTIGVGGLFVLLLLGVSVGFLFRWPRLLLGWCAGAFLLGPATLGVAAAVMGPAMTGGLGDIGFGFLILFGGFAGFVFGPVIGVVLGRLWQNRAARRGSGGSMRGHE
jgi:hypothetical protein